MRAWRGSIVFETLISLLLFSIFIIFCFHSIQLLNAWSSQWIMHRLAMHHCDNLLQMFYTSTMNQTKLLKHYSTWKNGNRRAHPFFTSTLQCEKNQCRIRLMWSTKQSGQSSCYFFTDPCIEFIVPIK